MTEKVQEALFEILYMSWSVIGLDNWFRHFKVGSFVQITCKFVGFGRVIHSTPFVPAGSNDEIEITLVPRRWPVSEEGTKRPEQGFCVRSDSGDYSRKNAKPGAWNRSQGAGGRVQELLYWCQSLTCGNKDQARRYVDLVPVVFPSEDGFGHTRDVCAECWTVLNGETDPLGA